MREAAKSRWFLPALMLVLFVSLGVRLQGAWPEETGGGGFRDIVAIDDATIQTGFCIGYMDATERGTRNCNEITTQLYPPAGNDILVTGYAVVSRDTLDNTARCEIALFRSTGSVEEAVITVGNETVTNTAGSGNCTNGDSTIDAASEGCFLDGLSITFVEGEVYQILMSDADGACTALDTPHGCCTGAGAGCDCTTLQSAYVHILYSIIPN